MWINSIFSMIEDTLLYLKKDNPEEYKTNQELIRMQDFSEDMLSKSRKELTSIKKATINSTRC